MFQPSLPPDQATIASKPEDEAFDLVLGWFLLNYEDVNGEGYFAPTTSESSFVHESYFAREILDRAFGKTIPNFLLERLVDELEPIHWGPAMRRLADEEVTDHRNSNLRLNDRFEPEHREITSQLGFQSRAKRRAQQDAYQRLIQKIGEVEEEIDKLSSAIQRNSDNGPPELLPAPYSLDELSRLRRSVGRLRTLSDAPLSDSNRILSTTTFKITGALVHLSKFVKDKGDVAATAFADELGKRLARPSTWIALSVVLSGKLQELLDALYNFTMLLGFH